MSSYVETYLILAPEFGGTKFGPFSGMEIRLGSDPSRNDVVLPETLGVLPEHVRVLSQGNDSFIIAPTERTAGVYVYRSGQRAKQILTPMAVTGGPDAYSADAFALVSADGPKFYIIREELKKASDEVGQGMAKAKKRLSSGSLLEELKRVGIVWLVTTELGKAGRVLYTFFRSGAFLHPRYVVGFALTMIGWVFAGGTACIAFNIASNKAEAEEQTERCTQRLDSCTAMSGGGGDGTSLHSLTASILGDQIWSGTLREDEELRLAYLKALKGILKDNKKKQNYRWVYQRSNTKFNIMRQQLAKRWGSNDNLVRVIPYIAAHEGPIVDRDWLYIPEDSRGDESCGRGVAGITWRQAHQLGLSPLTPDRLVDNKVTRSKSPAELMELVKDQVGTVRGLDGDSLFTGNETLVQEGAELQGGVMCLHVDGDDIRTKTADLANLLSKKLGPSAKKVPAEDTPFWIATRIAWYYAADTPRGWDNLDFSESQGISFLIDKNPKLKKYMLESTAEVMARAVAIPCLAATDKSLEEPPEHMGPLPDKFQCIMLTGGVELDVFN